MHSGHCVGRMQPSMLTNRVRLQVATKLANFSSEAGTRRRTGLHNPCIRAISRMLCLAVSGPGSRLFSFATTWRPPPGITPLGLGDCSIGPWSEPLRGEHAEAAEFDQTQGHRIDRFWAKYLHLSLDGAMRMAAVIDLSQSPFSAKRKRKSPAQPNDASSSHQCLVPDEVD
jgi:hypothetical protein